MTRARSCVLLALLLLALASPGRAEAPDVASAADALVEAVYYEGLPYARARALGPQGLARLRELLADETRSDVHANTLLAIGMAAGPGAYEALVSWAATSGDGSHAERRAERALPMAMGHLARHDARAVAWLASEADEARARGHGEHHARLATALGIAGTAEADAVLAAMQQRGDAPQPRAVAHARDTCARVAHLGPDAFFAPEAAR